MRRSAIFAVLLAVSVVAASCQSRTDRASHGLPSPTPAPAVVVASFNFPESEVLAEIYAGALERAGVPVRREMNLGPRELVQPALQQGLIDVVPEYAGSALAGIAPEVPVDRSDPESVQQDLARVIAPWHIEVLPAAAAVDQNALAVPAATATRLGLRSISDLAEHARDLVLTGPPECPTRPYCLLGWEQRYGLKFKDFVAYDTATQRAAALEQGVADVAVVFTTDPVVVDRNLVVLDDDRRLQPADNVVPLVSSRAVGNYGARLVDALDAVSAQLTTAQLTFLNWRVVVAGHPAADEARGWLERQH